MGLKFNSNKYRCKSCNINIKILEANSKRNYFCSYCSEELIAVPIFKLNQIISLIVVFSFALPPLLSLKYVTQQELKYPNQNELTINNNLLNKIAALQI